MPPATIDPDARVATAPAGTEPPEVQFSVAHNLDQVMEAWGVVYSAYRTLGLVDPNPWQVHCTPHALTNDVAVIRGAIQGRCVTTVTGCLDHPVHGLPLDAVYPTEIQRLRDQGCSLIEVGLFGDRRQDPRRARHTLLELMRWATWFGLNHGARQAIVGVHPHHAKFYAKCLGFEIIGEEKGYDTVNGAPVVPLFLDWAKAETPDAKKIRGLDLFTQNPIAPNEFAHRRHWQAESLVQWLEPATHPRNHPRPRKPRNEPRPRMDPAATPTADATAAAAA